MNDKLFLAQKTYVPVYVKQDVDEWKYMDEYKADSYSQDPVVIEKHRKHRALNDVSGILFLSSKDNVEVKSPIFPASKTKPQLETSAIKSIINYFLPSRRRFVQPVVKIEIVLKYTARNSPNILP